MNKHASLAMPDRKQSIFQKTAAFVEKFKGTSGKA